MIRFNPLNPRTQCQMVRGFNGLKRIIADQSREPKVLSEKQEITVLLHRRTRRKTSETLRVLRCPPWFIFPSTKLKSDSKNGTADTAKSIFDVGFCPTPTACPPSRIELNRGGNLLDGRTAQNCFISLLFHCR